MPRKLDYPDVGDPISAEWARALIDAINGLMEGPEVCSPLAKHDGGIYLAQNFEHFIAKTTAAIPARVGNQWKTGKAQLLTVNQAGQEVVAPGVAAFTAWNWIGAAIPTATRIVVCWAYDRWLIVQADCSGVA